MVMQPQVAMIPQGFMVPQGGNMQPNVQYMQCVLPVEQAMAMAQKIPGLQMQGMMPPGQGANGKGMMPGAGVQGAAMGWASQGGYNGGCSPKGRDNHGGKGGFGLGGGAAGGASGGADGDAELDDWLSKRMGKSDSSSAGSKNKTNSEQQSRQAPPQSRQAPRQMQQPHFMQQQQQLMQQHQQQMFFQQQMQHQQQMQQQQQQQQQQQAPLTQMLALPAPQEPLALTNAPANNSAAWSAPTAVAPAHDPQPGTLQDLLSLGVDLQSVVQGSGDDELFFFPPSLPSAGPSGALPPGEVAGSSQSASASASHQGHSLGWLKQKLSRSRLFHGANLPLEMAAEGPPHNRTFTATLLVPLHTGPQQAMGQARTKKEAERLCCEHAVSMLGW